MIASNPLLALLVLGLLLTSAGGVEDPRSWLNVLEPTSWLFDQGSQYGYRAEPSNPHFATSMDTGAGCAKDAEGRLPFQQQDTDFIGNNLNNAPTPTLQACCELCLSTAGCVAYSWNAATDKWCNCKFGSPNATQKLGEIAGRVAAPAQPIEHAISGPSPDWALGGLDTPRVSYRLLQNGRLDAAASSSASLYPGVFVLDTKMPGLGGGAVVSAALSFAGANHSANTTLVRFAARNTAPASNGRGQRSQSLDNVTLAIFGRAANTTAAATADTPAPASTRAGVNFALPAATSPEQSCFNVSGFKAGGLRVLAVSGGAVTDARWTTTVASDGTGIFELRSAPFSLLPGEERVVWVALTAGVAAQVDREASRASRAPEALFQATAGRWADYLTAALPAATPAGSAEAARLQEIDNVRWSSVKAVMTLMGNWRRVPGSGTVGNVLPSYVGYDRGAWSWDSYKQAAGMAHFAPQLAKDQLRVLAAARDPATGHIPDLTDRCGEGTGAAGKPPLLSWAVWQIFNATGDTDFVAEMYPVIEGFHRFYYTHRDTKGVALCSWTEGMESGMDNGARFINPHTVSNASTGVSTLDFWSIDLNAYLYREKGVLSDMAELLGNASAAAAWRADAAQLLPRLQRTFFVDGCGSSSGGDNASFFQDRYFNGTPVPVRGCEGYAALFCRVASDEQAGSMARSLSDPATFWLDFSLPTLSKADPAFQPQTGYWRGPTWLDQSWFAGRGLANYGHADMAAEIKRRVFARGQGMQVNDTTPLSENYDPGDGTALGKPHFSWSAAHVLMWAADV